MALERCLEESLREMPKERWYEAENGRLEFGGAEGEFADLGFRGLV